MSRDSFRSSSGGERLEIPDAASNGGKPPVWRTGGESLWARPSSFTSAAGRASLQALSGMVNLNKSKFEGVTDDDGTTSLHIQGLLQKLSSKRQWNSRYFVLSLDEAADSPPSLVYFPNSRKSKKRCKHVLQDAALVKVERKLNKIHLTAADGRVYALKARSREEALKWHNGLNRLCAIQMPARKPCDADSDQKKSIRNPPKKKPSGLSGFLSQNQHLTTAVPPAAAAAKKPSLAGFLSQNQHLSTPAPAVAVPAASRQEKPSLAGFLSQNQHLSNAPAASIASASKLSKLNQFMQQHPHQHQHTNQGIQFGTAAHAKAREAMQQVQAMQEDDMLDSAGDLFTADPFKTKSQGNIFGNIDDEGEGDGEDESTPASASASAPAPAPALAPAPAPAPPATRKSKLSSFLSPAPEAPAPASASTTSSNSKLGSFLSTIPANIASPVAP